MDVEYSVLGVLNFEQLDKFCKKFKIKSQDLKANFDGWRKLVIYTEERVFIFPRDPRAIEWLDVEISSYKFLNNKTNLPIPLLRNRYNDPEISFYEFAEVSRLHGIPYSKIEDEIEAEDVGNFLLKLSILFAQWHNLKTEDIPDKIKKREIYDPERYKFEIELLDPKTTDEAFNYFYEKLVNFIKENKLEDINIIQDKKTRLIWERVIKEIVSLKEVLLHGDIHEDQILIDSKENMIVTGILDWETVRLGNPIWEFNFFEWGFGIWKWWKQYSEFRKLMWKEYLKERKIELSTSEGLNLIYTIFEFLIVLRPKTTLATLIGSNQTESAKMCVNRLIEITGNIETKTFERELFG